MEKRYYIAYGSNLNIRQMRMRCPSARIIGTSVLKDYELLFKGSKTGSYLTVERSPASQFLLLYGKSPQRMKKPWTVTRASRTSITRRS